MGQNWFVNVAKNWQLATLDLSRQTWRFATNSVKVESIWAAGSWVHKWSSTSKILLADLLLKIKYFCGQDLGRSDKPHFFEQYIIKSTSHVLQPYHSDFCSGRAEFRFGLCLIALWMLWSLKRMRKIHPSLGCMRVLRTESKAWALGLRILACLEEIRWAHNRPFRVPPGLCIKTR